MNELDLAGKIEAVRMMAGHNQFTIEGCGWLAEICDMAQSALKQAPERIPGPPDPPKGKHPREWG